MNEIVFSLASNSVISCSCSSISLSFTFEFSRLILQPYSLFLENSKQKPYSLLVCQQPRMHKNLQDPCKILKRAEGMSQSNMRYKIMRRAALENFFTQHGIRRSSGIRKYKGIRMCTASFACDGSLCVRNFTKISFSTHKNDRFLGILRVRFFYCVFVDRSFLGCF